MDFLECCTCGVCMELFDDPRMLNCGHTYCQKCIAPLLHGLSRKASCPECRFESRQPVNGFPVNYGVRGMVSKVRASAGVRGVDSCGRCQKKALLSELFCCSTCEECSVETSRLCGLCIAKWHKGHDYKELELASEQDVDEALEKISSVHAAYTNNKNELTDLKDMIGDAVMRLENRLDEGIASIRMLVTDICNGTTLTKDQLWDTADVAAALRALRECRCNLHKTSAVQPTSSGAVPGFAKREPLDEDDVRATAWRRRFNGRQQQFGLPGAAGVDICAPWHADV
ncbi:putative proteinconserved [Aphelenchoides avenae]|nr:putative proteinconserved [Aphelenchus avenae]